MGRTTYRLTDQSAGHGHGLLPHARRDAPHRKSARWRSLRETTAALGVAMTTAKTHLENIFQKTGVKRQAELMRLAARAGPRTRGEPRKAETQTGSRRLSTSCEAGSCSMGGPRDARLIVVEAGSNFVPSAHKNTRQAGAFTFTLRSAASWAKPLSRARRSVRATELVDLAKGVGQRRIVRRRKR